MSEVGHLDKQCWPERGLPNSVPHLRLRLGAAGHQCPPSVGFAGLTNATTPLGPRTVHSTGDRAVILEGCEWPKEEPSDLSSRLIRRVQTTAIGRDYRPQ